MYGYGRRSTLSEKQPKADRALVKIDELPTIEGQQNKLLSMRISLRDMAQYYAADERLADAGAFAHSWDTKGSWGSSSDNDKYFPQHITNAEDAMKAVEDFEFPAEIRAQARKAARDLADIFQNVDKTIRVHDLTSGKLDRRKLSTIAEHTAAGTYDQERIRPYYRTLTSSVERPMIAVIADGANTRMWRDEMYIPRVVRLALSIQWACEAADFRSFSAITQGLYGQPHGYKDCLQLFVINQPGQQTPTNAYGTMLNRDLYRYGIMTIEAADYDAFDKKVKLVRGVRQAAGPENVGRSYGCAEGGNGVHVVRQLFQPNIVISIGNVRDKASADIILDGEVELEPAVKEIARQAKDLRKKNRS